MLRLLVLTLLLFFFSIPFSFTQDNFSQDSTEIYAVIQQVFEGMRQGDSAMVRETMYADVRMMTSYVDKEGKAKVQMGRLDRFLQAVGTPHEKVWNETIDAIHVEVDDNLAHAWVDYSFYVDEDFHHCGVDSFVLVREAEGWKIIHLADTRRTEGCQ
ncbi:MAG: nuclear transport factor 2 family protein [Bacteroidota bacterium]